MKKTIIRLTESDLHKIIRESVKRVLRESNSLSLNGPFDFYAFDYDKALKAPDLETYDKIMADRKKFADMGAENAQNYHNQAVQHRFTYDNDAGELKKIYDPRRTSSVGAYKYVHPEEFGYDGDEILDSFENSVEHSKNRSGFAY